MNVWLLTVAWYAGALFTLQQSVLYMRYKHGPKWRRNAARPWTIVAFTILWPFVLFVLASWKLIFPFGSKGRKQYLKERRTAKADQKFLANQERLREEQRRLRTREDDYKAALTFLAVAAQDQQAIEAALPPVPVMGRELAETEFTQWSEQVWNDRGKPWSIGALQKVRARHQRAKEVANS